MELQTRDSQASAGNTATNYPHILSISNNGLHFHQGAFFFSPCPHLFHFVQLYWCEYWEKPRCHHGIGMAPCCSGLFMFHDPCYSVVMRSMFFAIVEEKNTVVKSLRLRMRTVRRNKTRSHALKSTKLSTLQAPFTMWRRMLFSFFIFLLPFFFLSVQHHKWMKWNLWNTNLNNLFLLFFP